jgi:cytochrome b561
MAAIQSGASDRFAGYSSISILLHWLTAAGVIALYATHEIDDVHLAIGLVAAPVFLVRMVWRLARGFPRPSDQHPLLNLLARLVTLGFLLSLLAVTLTGLLLPALEGETLSFMGFGEFMLPISPDRQLAGIFEEIHEIAGNAFIPLLVLHVAGALKHQFVDKDSTLRRIVRPVGGGF